MALVYSFAVVALAATACAGDPIVSPQPVDGRPAAAPSATFTLVSTIAFTTNRDDPTANPLLAAEIYLMSPDGSSVRRLTSNASGEAFANLDPYGKKIVFDSNRLRTSDEPLNTSDLFVMNTDGSEQTFLIRGSSATWSPDGKLIAFHASASGTGAPIKPDPGAATFDSDIFVLNVDDRLANAIAARNITNSADAIDDDPDWSPNGDKIAFTSHAVSDNQINSVTAEIYVMNADGTGRTQLTSNTEEERGAAWSPDGTRIVYSCRHNGSDFEICVMNADGSGPEQLTDNTVPDLTATFSPDGQKILFHRIIAGRAQLWVMNPDGSGQTQLTDTPGSNLLAHWGVVRVHIK